MIARVPIYLMTCASLLIVLLPDTVTIGIIPLEWLLCAAFCVWRIWLFHRIKTPRCVNERQQQMLAFMDAGLELAQDEHQRRLLLKWCEANARCKPTQQQTGGD